jgi:hypothetical protein
MSEIDRVRAEIAFANIDTSVVVDDIIARKPTHLTNRWYYARKRYDKPFDITASINRINQTIKDASIHKKVNKEQKKDSPRVDQPTLFDCKWLK